MMPRNKGEKSAPNGSIGQLQKRINSISRRVDEFSARLDGSSTITSPERKQNYDSCDELKAEIDSISSQLSSLSKADHDGSSEDLNEQKRKEKQRLERLKSQLDRISEQLEPDEVEEDYFRKMQAGDVGASNSDILTDKADDDDVARMPESEEDEEDDDDDESEEESTANVVMVRKVEALRDFKGEQDGDLSFKKGEILTVIKTSEDGWWEAENAAGKQGVVPKTLLKIIEEDEESSPEKQEEESSVVMKEAADKVGELTKRRSGLELWKSLKRDATQETSATDVLKAMGAMPTGFRSTTLGKLARQENFQTSSWVIPKLSQSNVAFRDITWDPVTKQLRPRVAKTNRIFQVLSARMVPSPGTGIEIISRHVRIVIWDNANKQPLSNVHSVRATTSDKDPLTWNFIPKCPSSVFDSECVARINSNDDSLVILFELNMLYKRTSTGDKSEVACGWCVMKLFEENGAPVPNKTYEIPLNGGTPFDTGVDLDPSVSLKASTNRFQQVARTNRQPRLTVKVISYQRKEMYDMLPDTLLTCHVYTQFISLYRQLLTESIMDEGRDSQDAGFIMDPVISTFPKTLYTTDVMDSLKRCWDEKNKRDLKRSQRRDGAVMRRFFRDVYMDSVFPLLNSAELLPYIWGNDDREKERLAWIRSYCDKRTASENLLAPGRLYKPFNVDRFALDLSKLAAT